LIWIKNEFLVNLKLTAMSAGFIFRKKKKEARARFLLGRAGRAGRPRSVSRWREGREIKKK
jgi:hypothetical protein